MECPNGLLPKKLMENKKYRSSNKNEKSRVMTKLKQE